MRVGIATALIVLAGARAHAAPPKPKATLACTLGGAPLRDGGRAVFDDDVTCTIALPDGAAADDLQASIQITPSRPFPEDRDMAADAEPIDPDPGAPGHWSMTFAKGTVGRCADAGVTATLARGDRVEWTRALHVRTGCTLPPIAPTVTCTRGFGAGAGDPLADGSLGVSCHVALARPVDAPLQIVARSDDGWTGAPAVLAPHANSADLALQPPRGPGRRCKPMRVRAAILLDGAVVWTGRVRVDGACK